MNLKTNIKNELKEIFEELDQVENGTFDNVPFPSSAKKNLILMAVLFFIFLFGSTFIILYLKIPEPLWGSLLQGIGSLVASIALVRLKIAVVRLRYKNKASH